MNDNEWDNLSEEEKSFRMNQAIEKLEEVLDNFDRDPHAAKIEAKYDQLGASLRDMNEEQWEQAVRNMVETSDLTEDEVRNWFGRLSGKCEYDNATWTGR